MNAKRRRFVDEYLIDLNATQAAIRAGYSPHTAIKQGSRLLTFVDVRAAVDAGLKERSQRVQVTADDVARETWALATGPGIPPATRVAALALMSKHTGGFTDRTEHSGAVGVTVIRRETPPIDDD